MKLQYIIPAKHNTLCTLPKFYDFVGWIQSTIIKYISRFQKICLFWIECDTKVYHL